MNPRDWLRAAYEAAIEAVDPRRCVYDYLTAASPLGTRYVVAIGKAATPMTRGALDAGVTMAEGLVIHPADGPQPPAHSALRCHPSSHPIPDERSLDAGESLIRFMASAPPDARFLFLISGGASSLVEALPEASSVEGLAALNQRLLAEGMAISDINRIRRSVSRVKGGRLGVMVDGRDTLALLVSDVQGDDPAVIGSGLLTPPSQGPSIPSDCPRRHRDLLMPAPPGPQRSDGRLQSIDTEVIASNADALEAAARFLGRTGATVRVADRFLDGDARTEGARIAATLSRGGPGYHVWGGEPTVTLPLQPGQGGRMQALAVAAAVELPEADDWALLAAGTDGIDGVGGAAGAIVDGNSLKRGTRAGLEARQALDNADTGGYLSATGDQLVTGATGTNVMDMVIGWRGPVAGHT